MTNLRAEGSGVRAERDVSQRDGFEGNKARSEGREPLAASRSPSEEAGARQGERARTGVPPPG